MVVTMFVYTLKQYWSFLWITRIAINPGTYLHIYVNNKNLTIDRLELIKLYLTLLQVAFSPFENERFSFKNEKHSAVRTQTIFIQKIPMSYNSNVSKNIKRIYFSGYSKLLK